MASSDLASMNKLLIEIAYTSYNREKAVQDKQAHDSYLKWILYPKLKATHFLNPETGEMIELNPEYCDALKELDDRVQQIRFCDEAIESYDRYISDLRQEHERLQKLSIVKEVQRRKTMEKIDLMLNSSHPKPKNPNKPTQLNLFDLRR